MKHSIFFTVDAPVLCLMLFAASILMVMLGKWARDKFLKTDEQESRGGVNSLLAALFGLWGFILAFTFSSASARFESVRVMMVDEASMIRTVILRVETLPDSLRSEFKKDLEKYVQARIDYYEYAVDAEKFDKAKQDAIAIGKKLWTQTANISFMSGFSLAGNNMLNALTAMFDIAARRDGTLMSGIPAPITFMLFFVALVISFVGGFTSPTLNLKEWVVITGFILLACLIILVTLDMARPMRGLIKPDVGQEKIIQLKELF